MADETIQIVIKGKDEASGAFGKVTASVDSLSESLGKVNPAASKANSAFAKLSEGAMSLAKGGLLAAAGAIAGITVAGAGLVKGGLDINSSMEQVRAQLLAMTKDGALTEKILNDIRTEASLTPFAFEEMAKATAGLMPAAKASGMELMELVKTAEILAASNPAEGLEGAAFALREAAGGDLASVIERFNLPRQRLNELKEQGVPAIKAVQIAMSELGLDAGLVGNMAQTMTGRWSTFNDTIDTLKSTMSQPLFDLLKEGLTNMQTALDANMPKLQEIAGIIGQKLADGVRWMGETGLPLMQRGWELIQPAVEGVSNAIGGLVSWFETFQQGGAGGIVQRLGLNEEQRQSLIRVLAVFLEIKDKLRLLGEQAVAFVQEQFAKVKVWFDENMPLIQQTVTTILNAIADFWKEHGDAVWAIVSNAFEFLKVVIGTALDVITGIIKGVMQLINGDWEGAWQTIKETFWGVWEGLKTLAGIALNNLWNVLKEIWPEIETWWDGSLEGLITAITTFSNDIMESGKAYIENFKKGMEAAWEGLKSWFDDKLQGLRDLLPGSEPKDSSSPLFGLGKSGEALVKNFAVGIDGAASIAVGAVRRMGVQVARAVTEVAQESIVPLVNTMFPQLGAGLDGLTTGTDALTSAMQVMANQSTSAFGQMAAAAGQAAAAVGNVTREIHMGGWQDQNGQWHPSRNPRPDADGRTKPQRRGRWVSRQQPDGTYRREWEESGGGGGSIPKPDTSPPTKPFSDFQVPSPSTGGDAGTGGGATNLVETILAALRKAKDESLLGAGNSINLTANYPAESQVSLIDRTKMLSAIMGG